jgi:hypothetical protein
LQELSVAEHTSKVLEALLGGGGGVVVVVVVHRSH